MPKTKIIDRPGYAIWQVQGREEYIPTIYEIGGVHHGTFCDLQACIAYCEERLPHANHPNYCDRDACWCQEGLTQ